MAGLTATARSAVRVPAVDVGPLELRAGRIDVGVHSERGDALRRSTLLSTAGQPAFTGREADVRTIEHTLDCAEPTKRVVVLYGAPGLGKSRLAKEYAQQHVDRYPGGMFFLPFDRPPPNELLDLLPLTERSGAPKQFEADCLRALSRIGQAGRALLIYDAIADERTLADWLPPASHAWELIATSTSANWATAWRAVQVKPLGKVAARKLVTTILGGGAAVKSVAEVIAAEAAGNTMELCIRARTAYDDLRRGRPIRPTAGPAAETSSSYHDAWSLLTPDAQLVLQVASHFATLHVPVSQIVATLERAGKTSLAVEQAIDDARDRMLAAGDTAHVDVHQLVTSFVRDRAPLDRAIRRFLFDGLLAAADAFAQHPGDLARRGLLIAYSLNAADWRVVGGDGAKWHRVGRAMTELGQFAQALPWLERAVAAKELGGVHGRVNAESLGISLHQVGFCFAQQGRFAQALPWFERAVAASEQGDVHGRVDAQSLGKSLHQVGFCYAQQGQFAQALPWFERAVAASEQGDVHGHVDVQSLGRSLNQVGFCYTEQGQFAQALPWFERAVAAKEQGDVHGRVDAQSLGKSLACVGDCYAEQGQFAQALPWFERAVAAKEQGDVHGRVDAQSLGRSLAYVGDFYAKQGQFAQALPWFERAVAASEQGDVHGRVNAKSLGRSLHRVGVCYAQQGQFAQALPWFERAIAAKEQGDVHGRVDAASLGRSLHQVGLCFAQQGQFAQALPWFERAIAASEQGGVHGRVDEESLALSLEAVAECHKKLGSVGSHYPHQGDQAHEAIDGQ